MIREVNVARSLAVIVLLGSSAVSCAQKQGGPREAPTADEGRTEGGLSPAAIDLNAVTMTPGLAEYDFRVARQGERSAAIWIPEASEPGAIVLALHGAIPPVSGSAARGPAQTRGLIRCLAAPALEPLRPIIIAPRSENGEWWRPSDTEFVLGLALAARRRWPEAARQSVVLGYSNGGIGAWFFARLYPAYFSAAVPIASNETVVGPSPLPIYAIHGTRDELFSSERVRAAVESLAKRGQDVVFHEKYRGSHLAPCSYVPELANAARWLKTHAFPLAAARAAAK